MSTSDRIEVDWAVDSIIVGARHRKDLGDIDTLAASIEERGLLQLITITQDGVLICGARRLAAIKKLGWRTTNVWIRTDLSGKLASLMAERDDVISHKEYSKVELADMYAELKAEIAADAARRVQATQFTADNQDPTSDGLAESATPLGHPTGDSRIQAAKMLGGASHFTMERVLAIKDIAANPAYSEELRQRASEAVQQINEGSAVDPLFVGLRAMVQTEELEHIAADDTQTTEVRNAARTGAGLMRKLEAEGNLSPQEMERAAHAALDRVVTAMRGPKKPVTAKTQPSAPAAPRKKPVSQFLWLWREMATWPDDYDVNAIAAEVPDDKWLAFKNTMAASIGFMETVDNLRAAFAFAA